MLNNVCYEVGYFVMVQIPCVLLGLYGLAFIKGKYDKYIGHPQWRKKHVTH